MELCDKMKLERVKTMNLIKKVKETELYEFIKKAFKDGAIPSDMNEFQKCFSHETTDESLCFAYQFGKGEDDASMLFFYPCFCAVPPRYHKNLRNQEYCNIHLLILEYQQIFASKIDDVEYLKELLFTIKQKYLVNMTIIEKQLRFLKVYDDFKEDFNNQSPEEVSAKVSANPP